MSVSALKYAVRDEIRDRINSWLVHQEDVRIMSGPRPVTRAGLLFVSVYGFSARNTGPEEGYRLEESFNWRVSISMRSAWIDTNQVMESYLDDPERGMEFMIDQVKSLHGSFSIASRANALLTGGSSGFIEGTMIAFRQSSDPIPRGSDWWGASTRTNLPVQSNPTGWSAELTFTGPTRVRNVAEIGTY